MSKRKSYDLEFKLQVAQRPDTESNRSIAKELHIDERQVRDWRRQKVELTTLVETGKRTNGKRRRVGGAGRKVKYIEEEEEIAKWILLQRERSLRVTYKYIAEKARQMIEDPNFKASRGWVSRFIDRWGFSLRKKTTVGQRLPAELTQKVVSFVSQCNNVTTLNNTAPSCIGNMDETAIWYDMPGATTIAVKGTNSVPLLTTGHEKQRITVCLAAMANGCKIKPLVVFKGKRFPNELKGISDVIVKLSHNGWMNEDLTLQWIEEAWNEYEERRVLVWDSYRCHITNQVEDALMERSTDVIVVPGGCTKILQPADVSWNAPFKSRYREHYDHWTAHEDRPVTAAGNPRAPSKALMVQWVVEAWKAISTEVIIRSFVACGITTSNPNDIHCLGPSGVANAAYDEVLKVHQGAASMVEDNSLSSMESDSASDLFSDSDIDID